jgi:single-strand DNA-binding protein
MASYNKVILIGRLVADPELKQTGSGVAVTNFTIAVDRKYSREGQEKQADFPTIIAWRSTAEFICHFFKKGSAILIEGELQTRSWTDQNGSKRFATEVVADTARFCEAKKDSETNNTPQNQNAVQGEFGASGWGSPIASVQPDFEEMKADEDLPF